MPYTRIVIVLQLGLVCLAAPALAQQQLGWDLGYRIDLRASYRDSAQERFQLRFPFPPSFLPVGQTAGFMETVDAGQHVEPTVAAVQLEAKYGPWFSARARLHALDKYRRNPTSNDRTADVDELYIILGAMPEFLDRPETTSFFFLAGKSPRMERQPVRLLESYGLAATAFNRFEDVQAIAGGTVGRSFYWRLQAGNGNPLYFRDSNALAGDNGIPELRTPNPDPELKSGFPILYNAETEDLFFDTENIQLGQAVGYRWQNAALTSGFDVIVFHYRRNMAETVSLTGTFYGGDIDLLNGPLDAGLALSGRKKEETGARLYAELGGVTAIAQFTRQHMAGLERDGWEVEAGYRFPGLSLLQSIQPSVRVSDLASHFTGNAAVHPAPSIWWSWRKYDAGIRIGLPRGLDVTIEKTTHDVRGAPRKLNLDETLVTLRWRNR